MEKPSNRSSKFPLIILWQRVKNLLYPFISTGNKKKISCYEKNSARNLDKFRIKIFWYRLIQNRILDTRKKNSVIREQSFAPFCQFVAGLYVIPNGAPSSDSLLDDRTKFCGTCSASELPRGW